MAPCRFARSRIGTEHTFAPVLPYVAVPSLENEVDDVALFAEVFTAVVPAVVPAVIPDPPNTGWAPVPLRPSTGFAELACFERNTPSSWRLEPRENPIAARSLDDPLDPLRNPSFARDADDDPPSIVTNRNLELVYNSFTGLR